MCCGTCGEETSFFLFFLSLSLSLTPGFLFFIYERKQRKGVFPDGWVGGMRFRGLWFEEVGVGVGRVCVVIFLGGGRGREGEVSFWDV